MVQLSPTLPIFFFHQKSWELESFLFIEFYPRVQTPALLKLLHITPPPPSVAFCHCQSVHDNAYSLCPICSLLLHWRYSREQGEPGEHYIILGLQTFLNDITEEPVIYSLWVCNFFFCKVPRTKYGIQYT